MTNKRWELYLNRADFEDFTEFMEFEGFGGFTSSFYRDMVWVVCYPSDEVKMIARLRYNLEEIVDKFGVDVSFTDWPKDE